MMRTITIGGSRLTIEPLTPNSEKIWTKAERGAWESETFAFIRTTVDEDTLFVDIGAWVGAMSLVAATRARRVVAIEPDPVAVAELERNVALNGGRVEVWQKAVDTNKGTLVLYQNRCLGDSGTSSFGRGAALAVDAVTFDDLAEQITGSSKVCVKVDIEGHEYCIADQLIEFVFRHDAYLHLSLHPQILVYSGTMSRFRCFVETWDIIRRLMLIGAVRLAKTGTRATIITLIWYILLAPRPRNFSVTVNPSRTD